QHTRDVDPDRTRLRARAAERRGVGEVLHRPGALQHRGQQDPDRAGVRVAVGVAADLAVDRTHVQAGAAAQAVERLTQRAGDLLDATVVEEDQVKLLRSL